MARTFRSPFLETPRFMDDSTLELFFTSVADVEIDATAGLDGGPAFRGTSADGALTATVNPPEDRYFRAGGWFVIEALPAAEKMLFWVIDDNGDVMCSVSLGTDGTVSLWRGDPGTGDLLTQSVTAITDVIALGTPLSLGAIGNVHGTDGSLEFWMGDASDAESFAAFLRINGENTLGTGLSAWRGIGWGLTEDIVGDMLYEDHGDGALTPGAAADAYVSDDVVTSDMAANTGTVVTATDDAAPDADATFAGAIAIGNRIALSIGTVVSHVSYLFTRLTLVVKNAEGIDSSPSCAPLLVDDRGGYDIGPWRSVVNDEYRVIDRPDRVNTRTGVPFQTAAELEACAWGHEVQG